MGFASFSRVIKFGGVTRKRESDNFLFFFPKSWSAKLLVHKQLQSGGTQTNLQLARSFPRHCGNVPSFLPNESSLSANASFQPALRHQASFKAFRLDGMSSVSSSIRLFLNIAGPMLMTKRRTSTRK